MPVIELKFLKGRVTNHTEVDISENGMLIQITDDDGDTAEIHRYAWEDVVKAVNALLESTPAAETLSQLQETTSMVDSTQERVKGMARITVADDLPRLAGVRIEKPKAGQIQWGMMEVKELLDTFQSFLLLPEGYTIIGVFFEVAFMQWVVVVESDAIPLPQEGQMLPILMGTYRRADDGKVSLVALQIIK